MSQNLPRLAAAALVACLLFPSQARTAPADPHVRVTAALANVRSQPSLQGVVQFQAKRGDELVLLGEALLPRDRLRRRRPHPLPRSLAPRLREPHLSTTSRSAACWPRTFRSWTLASSQPRWRSPGCISWPMAPHTGTTSR